MNLHDTHLEQHSRFHLERLYQQAESARLAQVSARPSLRNRAAAVLRVLANRLETAPRRHYLS